MSEEKKYSIIGTVTIGADEYRDLIEEVAAANKKAAESDAEQWKEYRKRREAEEKCDRLSEDWKSLSKTCAEYLEYIEAEGLYDKFKLWKFNKTQEEE